MKSVFSSAFLIAALIGSTMFLSACNKKKDTIAKIYVRDSSNNPVSGSKVTLKGTSTVGRPADVNLNLTTETNAAGEAIFNFNDVYKKGQAGVAVLDIEATKNGFSAKGIIKVEEEVTSDETVFLPY